MEKFLFIGFGVLLLLFLVYKNSNRPSPEEVTGENNQEISKEVKVVGVYSVKENP